MSVETCKCEVCGSHEGKLFLHSRCHPNAPTWAVLDGHILTITCATCDKEICKVEVTKILR